MKVIYDSRLTKEKIFNPFIAIGVFDGVHRGHQVLIQRMIRQAKAAKRMSVVMTFYPHPVHVLRPEINIPMIISLQHRLKILESLGADVCVIVRFTKKFSRLTPQQFVNKFLVKGIRVQRIFIGKDFHFGKDRGGDATFLREEGRRHGFDVTIVPFLRWDNDVISSTMIRRCIAEGDLSAVRRLLGRPLSVLGKVVKGDGRGKILGYPTANIIPHDEAIPPAGVYCVKVLCDKKLYYGLANVGRRPSFKKNDDITVEVHFFDFHRDIYGKDIEVILVQKIRNEVRFDSRQEFISQLRKDEDRARRIFCSSP